jgi:chemotaxis protein methyltransferase CheR
MSSNPADTAPAPDILPALREIIERETGIVLPAERSSQLAGLLRDRMLACAVADPWEYQLSVMHGPRAKEEQRRLIGGIVVGETSFFRTADQFRALQEHVLPTLEASGANLPLRIWCAGCATGEEAYSIAISALEAFRGRFIEPVRILATDIHRTFLDTAEAGIYPASAVRGVPPLHLMKYFKALPDGSFQVGEEVRKLVSFEEGNLAGTDFRSRHASRFGVIFCRNVMIYFRPETTRRTVSMFFDCLANGGALFLGHSETLWGISDAFRLEQWTKAFFYRKPRCGEDPVHRDAGEGKAPGRRDGATAPSPASTAPPSRDTGARALALVARAEKMADRDLLDEAEAACREAVELDPGCAEASYLMAVVLRRKGRLAEALPHAERALSCDPGFVLGGVEAAECLSLQGREAEASDRWREVFRMLEGPVRFPRLSPATGLTAKSLREYVASRLAPPR